MDKAWCLKIVLALIAIVVLVGIYQPGLSGSFVLDDERNIESNEQIRIESLDYQSLQQAWQSGVTGGLKRPLAMLSFALSYYFDGAEARGFKAANVYIHSINTLLLWLLMVAVLKTLYKSSDQETRLQTKVGILASIISMVWALHPLHVSTVLYAVQRMTLLAATFTLCGLWLYILWRQSLNSNGLKRWVLPPVIFLTLILGVLCKESAVLLLGFIAVIELFLFSRPSRSLLEQNYRKIFWCMVVVSLLAGLSYLHFYQFWYAGDYSFRSFTLGERLLTEARMMFTYITWIIVPSIDQYGLFHDEITVSASLFRPITTLYSVLGLIALVVLALTQRLRRPWLGLGVGIFLVGHSLESSIIPLEIVFEHRNYLPSLGVVLIAVLAIDAIIERLSVRRRVIISTCVAVMLFLSSMTLLRSMEWSSYYGQMAAAVERNPNSARTQWAMAIWYLQTHSSELALGIDDPGLYEKAREHALLAAEANKEYTSSYFGLILFHFQHFRPFPGEWIDELGRRLEESVYHIETDEYFDKILDCYRSDSCYADEGSVDFLYRKVLANKTLPSSVRSRLLSAYSAFKYKDNKLQASALYLNQAVDLVPTKERYRNLVVLYLELKNVNMAKNNLQKFKSLSDQSDVEEIIRIEGYVNQCCDKPLP
jgi:hypothetical protein